MVNCKCEDYHFRLLNQISYIHRIDNSRKMLRHKIRFDRTRCAIPVECNHYSKCLEQMVIDETPILFEEDYKCFEINKGRVYYKNQRDAKITAFFKEIGIL